MSVVDDWGMIVVDRVFEDYLLLMGKEEEDGDRSLFDVAVVEVVELLVHPPEVIFLLFLVVEDHLFWRFHVHDGHDRRRNLLASQATFCLKQVHNFGFELVDDGVMLRQCRTKIDAMCA